MADWIYSTYEAIGGFFTGSSRRRYFWVVIVVIVIASFLTSLHLHLLAKLDTLYWTFSSLIQALLALVGLMGVVSVFKLQAISNDEQKVIEDAKKLYSNVLIDRDKLDRLIREQNSTAEVLRREIKIVDFKRDNVINSTLSFVVYTFTLVLFNLAALMFATRIEAAFIGIPMLILDFILVGYSFFLSIKGVAASIQK